MNKKHILYDEKAELYDLLYSYKNYEKEVANLVKLANSNLKVYGKKINILDLACGTGEHLKFMTKHFPNAMFDGVDLNSGAIQLAKMKMKKKIKINFSNDDMLSYLQKSKKEYNLITCLFSSIQYITNPTELRNFFKETYKHTTLNGVFIFDLRYAIDNWRINQIVSSTYHSDKIDVTMIGMPFVKNRVVTWNPAIIWKKNGMLDMTVDKHEIYLYSVNEMRQWLEDVDYSVEVYNDFSFNKYDGSAPPVFVAKKAGQ